MRPVGVCLLAAVSLLPTIIGAQSAPGPRVELVNATTVRLSGAADSNSPLVWERVSGIETLFAVTSVDGLPRRAAGRRLEILGPAQDVVIDPWPGGGVWMEAIVPDVDGTWYGYHHNEIGAPQCPRSPKVSPRIGAARSRDQGRTWEPLGVVLGAAPFSHVCSTPNEYFVGGVGDFSVQLDANSRDLYFFYSQYHRFESLQGVGVARLAWADRDNPEGRVTVWNGRAWAPVTSQRRGEPASGWRYPAGRPVFPAAESWHDDDDVVDAFWGPSVHWNTYLQRYVMLLNRAKDPSWTQEGIYVSFAPRLDDPSLWSAPVKILNGGLWYPQVVGLELGTGTDRVAGQRARLFVGGVSRHYIQFRR